MDPAIENEARLLDRVLAGELPAWKAARILGIGNRQLRRRKARYLDEGPAGLISKKVGRPAANRIDPRIVEDAAALLRTIYADFGPKFASEKLEEQHSISLSSETVRKIMIAEGIWTQRRDKPVEQIQRGERSGVRSGHGPYGRW